MAQEREGFVRVLDRLVERVPVNQIAIVLIAAFATYALIRTLEKISDPWNQRLLMFCVVLIWVLALFMVFIRSRRDESRASGATIQQLEEEVAKQIPTAPTEEEYRKELQQAQQTSKRVKT
jgi:predicted PurR-regulated permease PerM